MGRGTFGGQDCKTGKKKFNLISIDLFCDIIAVYQYGLILSIIN